MYIIGQGKATSLAQLYTLFWQIVCLEFLYKETGISTIKTTPQGSRLYLFTGWWSNLIKLTINGIVMTKENNNKITINDEDYNVDDLSDEAKNA